MDLSGNWIGKSKLLKSLAAVAACGVLSFSPLLGDEHKEAAKPSVEQPKAAEAAPADTPASGKEIFAREWLPNDKRSHGGDGLGPVFNDSSCVACHNQGGAGGAGPTTKNVNIVSAFLAPQNLSAHAAEPSLMTQFFRSLAGLPAEKPRDTKTEMALRKERVIKQLKQELQNVHPGFASARSVVLHHFGNDTKYDTWRAQFLQNQFQSVRFNQGMFIESVAVPVDFNADTEAAEQVGADKKGEIEKSIKEAHVRAVSELQRVRLIAASHSIIASSTSTHGSVTTTSSQRNPTALFGSGHIDSISNEAIEAQAAVKHANPQITGRVSRLDGGKIGRFGWKLQKASLYDFTVTACGVELGLNVPDHPQSGQPLDPKYQPTGFDLDQREVDALVGYLKDLPAPTQTLSPAQKEFIHAGQKVFSSAGCADCHVEKLAKVDGIYSDLLLHDMGDDTADSGGYGVFVPSSPGSEGNGDFPALTDALTPQSNQSSLPQFGMRHQSRASLETRAKEIEQNKIVGATRFEWRTPPLWGVRDSGPYMHDGRAATLEHAIALHGGEAQKSALEFFALSAQEQQQLIAFLKTLVAPDELALAK